MATFARKIDVACSGIVLESFIFAKDYHHSRMFSRELEEVNNSQKFSFADYSCYTVVQEPSYMYACYLVQ